MTIKILSKAKGYISKIKIIVVKLKNPNVRIGHNIRIDWQTKIDVRNNKLIIGDGVYLRSKHKGYHAGMPFPTTILIDNINAWCKIGNNSRINGCYIHAKKQITIGDNTVIAAGTNILDSNGHITDSQNRTIGRDLPQPIEIGNNVWIGLNCIILKGTRIGDNCVVAAGSVVKGIFPDNCIIQGNPAQLVKFIKLTL